MYRFLHSILLTFFVSSAMLSATEYWLFAGQSNMSPKGQSREAFAVIKAQKPGIKLKMVEAQNDGKPISFWLPEKNGGLKLDAAFEKIGDQQLAGFVWQQAESNQSLWHYYEAELEELIQRIRNRANNPELPVFINQLGPRYLKLKVLNSKGMTKSKHSKEPAFATYWNMAFMRELQRRFALAHDNVTIIPTIDLTLRDKGVHFDSIAHREIGSRVGLAATGQASGPIPMTVRLDPNDKSTIILTCSRVEGSLKLEPGWELNAGLSKKPGVALPEKFSDWPTTPEMHPSALFPPAEVKLPTKAKVRSANTIAFTYAEPVSEGDLFHWCFEPGINEPDVVDDIQPAMKGITDETGITAVATALLPVKASL